MNYKYHCTTNLTFCLPSEYKYVISLVMDMGNKNLKIKIFYHILFSQTSGFIIDEKYITLKSWKDINLTQGEV